MTDTNDSWRAPEQEPKGRREFLKKGLVVTGAGGVLASAGASRAEAERDGLSHREFDIWAADHIEIDYRFTTNGPVDPVTDPEPDHGAEVGGNDSIETLGGNRYRVTGRTGFGENDIWFVPGRIESLVITDSRTD